MKKTANLLLIYSCAFAIFIVVVSLVANPSAQTLISQLLFLPVVLFLIAKVFQLLKKSEADSAPLITKRYILLFFIILFVLVCYGFSAILKGQKVQETDQGEKLVIKRSETTPSPTPTPKLPEIMINSKNIGFVNVRKEPSTSSEIVAKAKDKEVFMVYEKTGNWYKVGLDENKFGYININYAEDVPVSTDSGELNTPI